MGDALPNQPINHSSTFDSRLPTMQLEILTFCDAAVEYAGRLNLLGATDTIFVPATPFRYAHCAIALRVRAARIEEGEHTVRIMIIDVDGNPRLNVEGKLPVRFPNAGGGAFHLIINAQNLEFANEGEYAIEVAVDGIQLGSSPLFVRLQPAGRPLALPAQQPSAQQPPAAQPPAGQTPTL